MIYSFGSVIEKSQYPQEAYIFRFQKDQNLNNSTHIEYLLYTLRAASRYGSSKIITLRLRSIVITHLFTDEDKNMILKMLGKP
jgi:hypothetical protein